MKIAISTESTCDLSKEQISSNNIKVISYIIILGEDSIVDGDGVTEQIFDYVKRTKQLPKTSALNVNDYISHFSNILKEYDAIIHIGLSSAITSAYSHSVAAAEKFKNVYSIDSMSLSTGMGLLVLYAKQLVDEGLPIEEIVKKVEERRQFVQASFVIDRLDYLYKGGRCNALAMFGANLLKIHPQIVLKDGAMKPAKKYHGKMHKVVTEYCKDTLKEFNHPDKSLIFITHTSSTPEMIASAKAVLEAEGFNNIVETNAGGTITSHCGENVLGLLYFNDGK